MDNDDIDNELRADAKDQAVILRPNITGIGNCRKIAFGAIMLVFSSLSALPASAMGEDESGPHRLVDVPTPEVLPHLGALLTVDGRIFTGKPDVPEDELLAEGPDIRLGIGILNRAEVGVEAMSVYESLDRFTGYLKVFILKESRNYPAIGAGIFDLTTEGTPNIDSGLPFTECDEYLGEDKTNNSAYVVLAKHIPHIEDMPLKLRFYLGIGRGRFIDRCGAGEDLNGAFFGGELKHRSLRFMAEVGGRAVNVGLGSCMPIYEGKGYEVAVNGVLQGRYLQHVQTGRSDAGLYPAIGGRLGLCIVPMED